MAGIELDHECLQACVDFLELVLVLIHVTLHTVNEFFHSLQLAWLVFGHFLYALALFQDEGESALAGGHLFLEPGIILICWHFFYSFIFLLMSYALFVLYFVYKVNLYKSYIWD